MECQFMLNWMLKMTLAENYINNVLQWKYNTADQAVYKN